MKLSELLLKLNKLASDGYENWYVCADDQDGFIWMVPPDHNWNKRILLDPPFPTIQVEI